MKINRIKNQRGREMKIKRMKTQGGEGDEDK
jgi:hypothetical protein